VVSVFTSSSPQGVSAEKFLEKEAPFEMHVLHLTEEQKQKKKTNSRLYMKIN